ncbi:MAG: N-acyl homoserine lactonase family protein [Sarcina sp.]
MNDNIKIHIFHCGEVGVDPAVPFRDVSKNPIAYTGIGRRRKLRIWCPVSAYFIEHPKGKVLIDTGWHKDVRKHPIKHMSATLYMASKPNLPQNKAIDEQLSKLGIYPKDLDYVFLTHMDCDHASGIGLVKDAKKIMISEEEFQAVKKGNIRYRNRFWKGVNIEYFKMKDSEYGPFKRSYDVFGDGSILLMDAKGHTEGNIIIMIKKHGKFILLTGDCGYQKNSWEDLRLPGPLSNKYQMMVSLKWVRDMSHKENCVGVFATHDPDIKSGVIEL